ncbi:acetylcholinesterase-1-like [Oppia nitens]|uniref:acetylcholinesterase-1-like n=1 Tax=Oppia nitens TaxID=1686743 RepID=UPI0023DC145D|nr:acetylcholinesterase-1-like [Oppia nitens]
MKKSVMYWIHGGSFITGSISYDQFNATYLSALGDVIVVEVGYRLSALGFLYDGTEEAPGNQAFSDYLISLQFIQKNIEFFGGDPNSVTIFGESAGSMAVSALMLIKNGRNLFNRTIMQSGSVNSYLGSEPKESALIKAQDFATKFNCFDNSSNKINISCLRSIDVKQIVNICDTMRYNNQFFTPIFGDQFLPLKPEIALKRGDFKKNVDLLFGTCSDEGSGFVSDLGFQDMLPDSPNNSMTVSKSKLFIQLIFSVMKVSNIKKVADFYTKGLKDSDGVMLKKAVANSFGDYQLTCPTISFGSKMVLSGKAYSYKLTFSTRHDWTGVQHGDDIQYVFGGPLRNSNHYSDDVKHLSHTFINIWTTFAKTGVPPKVNGIDWPEAIDRNHAKASVRYMTLNPNNYKIVDNAYRHTCDDFWNKQINT